ncbi:MAG: hypothetical protein WB341_01380 [Terracidiphilus sp.]
MLTWVRRRMLHAMQQSAQTEPSPTSSSFAGMLAALASPSRDAAECAPASTPGTEDLPLPGFAASASSESDIGEDLEALSYERALRTRARYIRADRGNSNLAQPARQGPGEAQVAPPFPAAPAGVGLEVQASAAPRAELDRDLRRTSVTIRLSEAECARLRKRAAEAGVTVSAYLRSCTFEAEALRAQVKEALAELRQGGEAGNKGTSHPSGHKSPAGGPGREQGNKGMRLTRVLAHLGSLCIGFSAGKSS